MELVWLVEMYRIGKMYKLFLKPEYNNGRQIVYNATIIGREGNKLLILKDGEEIGLDIDWIGESKLVGGLDGRKEDF